MNRTLAAALAALALISPAAALAQKTPDNTVFSKRTVLDMTGAVVTGEVESGPIKLIAAKPRVVFPTLVTVRANFAPELLRSVDSL